MKMLDVVRSFARREGRLDLERHAEEFAAPRLSRQLAEDFFGEKLIAAPWLAQVADHRPGIQLLSVLPSSALQLPDLEAFVNEVKGISELLAWPLYAYKAYPTAGATQILFFDQSENSPVATGGTRPNTNMVGQGGALPGNQMYVAVTLEVVVIPGGDQVSAAPTVTPTAGRDFYNVLRNLCWLEFKISQKEVQVLAPLTLTPTGFGVGTVLAGAPTVVDSVSHLNNGNPDNKAVYHLDPPVGLLPVRPFSVSLNWRTAQAVTASTPGHRIGVLFKGWLIRAVL
jgi:hypothetical protein